MQQKQYPSIQCNFVLQYKRAQRHNEIDELHSEKYGRYISDSIYLNLLLFHVYFLLS